MPKTQLLSYGVMVGVSVCLAVFFRHHLPLPATLAVIVAAGLVGWLHERQKAEIREQAIKVLGDIKHDVNNALTVVVYARELRPKGYRSLLAESYARIRLALNAAPSRLDTERRDYTAEAASPSVSSGPLKPQPRPAQTAEKTPREIA